MYDSMGIPLEPREEKIIGHDYQGEEIYEYDTYYIMPNGDKVLEGYERDYVHDVGERVDQW
jgi:hypothetical protein